VIDLTPRDDPSGEGWRDVLPGEILQPGDMAQQHLGWATFPRHHGWQKTRHAGTPAPRYLQYRRRIEKKNKP
jgi:hypothetical protein